jgi:putative hemolysin
MEMQSRLDRLIFDRAPWLASDRAAIRAVRAGLNRVLSYHDTVALAEALKDKPARHIMAAMARLVATRVTLRGAGHIPAHGAALMVANHPTGIADGLALTRVLMQRRPDAYFFANADILKLLPQLDEVITPVEWRQDRRSAAKARITLQRTKAAIADARIGIIFPSGRLAKRRGLRLVERPWMPSAASMARKYRLPVVPVHIEARNSALFYGFDLLHPSLRDITLFHEVLNKTRQRFVVTVGAPVPPEALPRCPEAATQMLRQRCLGLGADGVDAPDAERGLPLLHPRAGRLAVPGLIGRR